MKKKCEVDNCKERVFATAYPEDIKYRLCKFHFKDKFYNIIQSAEIVDKTNE